MFKKEKAIATAAYLLKLQNNLCDKYWLAKVMYYVERESLIKNGQALFSDQLYSIPYGPVVSEVNDGIDLCEYDAKTIWNFFFTLKGKIVELIKDADYSLLSSFERKIIESAYQKFKGWSFDQLHDFFSKLPEYKNTNSREIISYEEILAAEGYDPSSIQQLVNEIYYINKLESNLHCA
jgi:uncharacterized phage-associated protein